uniref:hypothetical protein n=1 Tax=Pseudonocardia sp. CA-138482 TaxID=3240023 RepID=UPI003F49078D
MSALSQLRDRLTPGTPLICLENTFRPIRNGARQTVTALRRDRVDCVTEEGARVSIYLPTARRDITWLDDDTARWDLRANHGRRRREGHTVTYRIGAERCAGAGS